jgi:hypothetical protein
MQRPVFERTIIDGFKSPKTETVAMTSVGKRMFAGTNDGTLALYECRPDSVGSKLNENLRHLFLLFKKATYCRSWLHLLCFGCNSQTVQRKEACVIFVRGRGNIYYLYVLSHCNFDFLKHWRTLLGIMDGTLMAYDSQFYQQLGSASDSKGCHIYAVHEKNNTVVVANKKKLLHFSWQSPGFQLRREFNLIDTPKSLCCLGNSVVIGYKKFYECLDLGSGTTNRLVDVEKECRMVTVEVD